MSGLCGWIGYGSGTPETERVIERMAVPLQRFDASRIHRHAGSRSAIAVATPGDDFSICNRDGVLVGIWGRAQFTDPRLQALARRDGFAHTVADRAATGLEAVPGLLSGSFALAVLNERTGEAVIAIDRMGVRPLSYVLLDGCIAFGSSADALNLHPLVKPQTDRQSIFNYVYFHAVPGPGSIHAKQRRLLPGECLVRRNGKAEVRSYWQMHFAEDVERPFSQLKTEFLQLLRESVSRAATGGTAGAFLSGGTDSSTIAGVLGEVSGEPARTYSIGFEAQGYDEIEYARIAARRFGTRHHEYYVTPDDVVRAIPQIAAIHDQPFGNSSAVPTYYCAKLARDDGVEILLGGDGGDELFGGNARYAKQYLYSLYSGLPARLRKGVIEPVAFLLPGDTGMAGRIQRYLRNASQAMPARYDNYNLLERLGPASVFLPEFLDAIDPGLPSAQMARAYNQAHAQTLINRMLALDLKYTLADNDLPKVTRSCELAGVDVRFPLLDDALVSFSARLAPGLKLKRTKLRYFFKQALRGFLPDEIIHKKKHGFGLPFGPWLQVHKPLRQLVGDSLHDLKGRGIVHREFIDTLLNELLQSHAGYYGTMAWVLMMLEQWFKHHRDN